MIFERDLAEAKEAYAAACDRDSRAAKTAKRNPCGFTEARQQTALAYAALNRAHVEIARRDASLLLAPNAG